MERPHRLSVIVPAHNAEAELPRALAALADSTLPRNEWELIVVDDGSTDATKAAAAPLADSVLSTGVRARGPAHARNLGAAAARSDILVFVDADVAVHPGTLDGFSGRFAQQPGVSAIFGSYDDTPAAPGVVSRFRNLLHHAVHQQGEGDAETFWAGCGAVRRDAFEEVGGFDARRYPSPQIEDIELGHRLRSAGHRIVLDPALQGTHLKRLTLAGMVRTDFHARGLPWMRLILEGRPGADARSLNLRPRQRVATLAALVALLCLAAAPLAPGALLSVAALALLVVLTANLAFYRLLLGSQGFRFAAVGLGLHVIHYATAAAAGVVAIGSHVLRSSPGLQREGA